MTVLGAVLTFLAGFVMARWRTRKDYEYKRSQHVTEKRFDLELEAIQALTENLYLLCVQSERNAELEAETRRVLGRYAAIIDYRDSDGNRTCGIGVRSGEAADESRLWRCGHGWAQKRHTCSICQDAGSCGNDPHWQESLFTRAEALLNLAVSMEQRPRPDALVDAYMRFVGYAWARLKSVEMGRRDRRRQTAKEILLPWRTDAMASFDDRCGIDWKDASHRRCPIARTTVEKGSD